MKRLTIYKQKIKILLDLLFHQNRKKSQLRNIARKNKDYGHIYVFGKEIKAVKMEKKFGGEFTESNKN